MGLFKKIAKKIISKATRKSDIDSNVSISVEPPISSAKKTGPDLSNIECSAQELRERMEAGEDVIVIDVREEPELKASGIIP